MMIFLLSRPSGCAGIVDGEDSKQRVEKQAAHGEPLLESGMKTIHNISRSLIGNARREKNIDYPLSNRGRMGQTG